MSTFVLAYTIIRYSSLMNFAQALKSSVFGSYSKKFLWSSIILGYATLLYPANSNSSLISSDKSIALFSGDAYVLFLAHNVDLTVRGTMKNGRKR